MPDREKVIKAWEIFRDSNPYGICSGREFRAINEPEYCMGQMIEDTIALLKEHDTGWISVKERLPENQTPVLVYVPPYIDENEECIGHVAMSYYTCSVRGGYWAGTDGNVYGAIGIIHDPSHWMPLPKPPKE